MKGLRSLGLSGLAAVLFAGSNASAQGPDGAWLDRAGRYTSLQFGGSQPTPLVPGDRGASDYVTLFKEACVGLPFGPDQPRPILEKRGWGFQRLDMSVPAGKTAVDLSGWQAKDVSVRSSLGVFFAPNPQCNVTAALTAPMNAASLEALVTQSLGTAPANLDKKVDKKGQRRRGYEPMWKLAAPTGTQRTIYARVFPDGAGARLHLGALESKAKSK